MSFTFSRGIFKVSATILVRSWKSLKSPAIGGGGGISASTGEEDVMLVHGVISSSSPISCFSSISSEGSQALETIAEKECLAVSWSVNLVPGRHSAHRLPIDPKRDIEAMEKAWVVEPIVGHTTEIEVQTKGMTGKVQDGISKKGSESNRRRPPPGHSLTLHWKMAAWLSGELCKS